MIRMTLLFLTTMPFQASRIHALDKDFHPHCFKCEVANTCIIIIIITTTTIIIVIIIDIVEKQANCSFLSTGC